MAAVASVELGTTKQTPSNESSPQAKTNKAFQSEDISKLKTTESSATLKTADGNRFIEPFRVAGAVAGRVFEAARTLYGNVATDIRVANAAKEMEKFIPKQIATGASASEILKAWTETANKHAVVNTEMTALGGAAGEIVSKTLKEVTKLRQNIEEVLSKQKIGDRTLVDFTGREGAKLVSSLSSDQKREFLKAYDDLRNNLGQLDSIAQKATDQAKAFYEHSMKPFEKYHEFMGTNLERGARKHYVDSCNEIHKTHVKRLKTANTPEEIKAAGKEATEALETLQERVKSLSTSLIKANTETSKVEQTLKYLTDGVDGDTGVGASDKSVVFVSADAANKIAGWVQAQTKEALDELTTAKAAKDPEGISAATEKLVTASDAVHKQLDDIATLLKKVNSGRDETGTAVDDQEKLILAKVAAARVASPSNFSADLTGYVGFLRKTMEDRVGAMFTPDAEGKYDLAAGKKGLAVIDKYGDMLGRTIDIAAINGLEAHEVKEAVAKVHALLQAELTPPTASTRSRIENIVEATKAAIEKESAPPKTSLWGRFKSWFPNN